MSPNGYGRQLNLDFIILSHTQLHLVSVAVLGGQLFQLECAEQFANRAVNRFRLSELGGLLRLVFFQHGGRFTDFTHFKSSLYHCDIWRKCYYMFLTEPGQAEATKLALRAA